MQLNLKDFGTLLNLFQRLGATTIRMNKDVGKFELAKSRRWVWFNRIAILFCFVRLTYLVSLLIWMSRGQFDIPTANIVNVLQIIGWVTTATCVLSTLLCMRHRIVYTFNVFLQFQIEVEEIWVGRFDHLWKSVQKLFKYFLLTVIVSNVVLFFMMTVGKVKPFHTSFLFGQCFITKILLSCFDVYVQGVLSAGLIAITCLLLIYVIPIRKGLQILRHDELSPSSIRLYRKYELVNQIFNQLFGRVAIPLIIVVFGFKWIIKFCIVVRTLGSVDSSSYIAGFLSLSSNTIASALLMTSAASIHKSTLSILDGWKRQYCYEAMNDQPALINTEGDSDAIGRNEGIATDTKSNMPEPKPSIIAVDSAGNSKDSTTEQEPMSANKGETSVDLEKIDPHKLLYRKVKSMKPFGVQVADFYILRKSTATSYYQIITDIAINILLASKGLNL